MDLAFTRRGATLGAVAALAAPGAAFAHAAKDADVVILGAGLAGLYAARKLHAAGMNVIVVEALNRVGGRLHTIDALPDAPNAGGVQIGGAYRRVREEAQGVGVALVDDTDRPAPAMLHVAGRWIAPADWAAAAENPFPTAHKALTPGAALQRLIAQEAPLADFDAWRSEEARARDVSVDAFLQSKGFSPAARALIDHAANANRLAGYSMLNLLRSAALFRAHAASGPVSYIRDGGQRLPEAMAASLPDGAVRLNHTVAAIEADQGGVIVSLRTGLGSPTHIRAPFAICTLPFAALRGLRRAIKAPLSAMQREAIAAMDYTQIVQVIFEPTLRFWEQDGMGPDMWTDGPFERLFALKSRTTNQPNGLMLAWINGAGCEQWRNRSDAQIEAALARALARLRPASQGRVRVRHVQRWTSENPFAGGAYMGFAPGHIARWAGRIDRPAGRLHFAGEHLSLIHTGMEGALESAQTACDAILTAAGARQ